MHSQHKNSIEQSEEVPRNRLAISTQTFLPQGVSHSSTGGQVFNDTAASGHSYAVACFAKLTSLSAVTAMTVLAVSLGLPLTAQASDPVCQLKIRQLDQSIEQVRQLGPMHRVQLQALQNAQSAFRSDCTASKAISWQRNAVFDAEENIAFIYDAMRSAAGDPNQSKRLENQLVQARKQAATLRDELEALQAVAGQ